VKFGRCQICSHRWFRGCGSPRVSKGRNAQSSITPLLTRGLPHKNNAYLRSGRFFGCYFLENAGIEQSCPSIIETLEQRYAASHYLSLTIVYLMNTSVFCKELYVLQISVKKIGGIVERDKFDLFRTNGAKGVG
jgi:hypothetical protein